MISTKDTTRLRSRLRSWYKHTGVEYPWRGAGATAYTILVSEFMLQQTQAARVAQLLPIFLNTFSSLDLLAAASNAQVIQAWKGLGYNNRALRLRDTARIIFHEYEGVIPDDPAVLLRLPGIGPYASQSLPCFVYGKRTLVVDVNVRRVYSRWFQRQLNTASLEVPAVVLAIAEQMVPRLHADVWHHAVMDLGASICKARNAACTVCPVRNVCASAGVPLAPFQRSKAKEPMLRGEPRRLWRGRLVEKLRHAGPRGLRLNELLPDAVALGAERSLWMDVLEALERDALIRVGKRIRLRD